VEARSTGAADDWRDVEEVHEESVRKMPRDRLVQEHLRLEGRVDELTTQLAALQRDSRGNRCADRDELLGQIGAGEARIRELNDRLDLAAQRARDLQQALVESDARRAEIQGRYDALVTGHDLQKKDLQDVRDTNGDLMWRLSQKQIELDNAHKTAEKAQREFSVALGEGRAKWRDCERNRRRLQEELAAAEWAAAQVARCRDQLLAASPFVAAHAHHLATRKSNRAAWPHLFPIDGGTLDARAVYSLVGQVGESVWNELTGPLVLPSWRTKQSWDAAKWRAHNLGDDALDGAAEHLHAILKTIHETCKKRAGYRDGANLGLNALAVNPSFRVNPKTGAVHGLAIPLTIPVWAAVRLTEDERLVADATRCAHMRGFHAACLHVYMLTGTAPNMPTIPLLATRAPNGKGTPEICNNMYALAALPLAYGQKKLGYSTDGDSAVLRLLEDVEGALPGSSAAGQEEWW
jgi:predicted  nucleic acid-binding Zn-ribbon protein